MKPGTPRHPKTQALAEQLGEQLATAVGILEMLWHFTAEVTPAGDIGKYTPRHIARHIGWSGDPEELITALIDTRWLDPSETHGLIVHDWPIHCTDNVHSRLANARLTFADGTEPKLSKFDKKDRPGIQADYGGEDPRTEDERYTTDQIFDDFWDLYPKKLNRKRAQQAWRKVVKTETMARIVLQGQQVHLQPGGNLARDPQYIASAENWLHKRHWEDEYLPSKRALQNHIPDREPTDEDVLRVLTGGAFQ